MRIALVTDYYLPTLGGVQTAVRALAESLRAAGHEAIVFCPLAAASPDPGVVGLPVSGVFRPDGYPFAWSPARLRTVLRREFAERRIDVVHTHSEMFAALGAVRAADDLGIPVVHTMHGRIDVYTRNVLPLPSVTTVLLAFLHGRQVSAAGIRVAADAPYTRTRTARRMWRVMLAQSRASAHVVVPSEHFAAKLVDRGVRTPVTVLTNGIEPSVLDTIGTVPARTLHADEPLRVVWVGRLSPEKRPDVLVRAAHDFPSGVHVDVYGDGVARSAVARAARGADVTLHGSTPHDQVLAAMRSAHLLVSSSFDFDNQPMVMLEAIASGLPVLHCDPDLAEVVPAGAGFLASTPDAAGLAAEVRRLRADPGAITRASEAALAARSRVEQPTDALLDVYRSVRTG
ncbi:glycosyltransferase involved in cell wall biosynthesis [Curtobacterium flaccumfaciens]|uniref:D-inositol 3-phosphate glycosyltransferase n=1 Tax=Curtobacterium flaccumfaciens TaxID=2035 RepID=A0A4R6DE96_9MICO|nr:glycosyltransferase [Curtobacterium flaccumfaciens]TDN42249.1 glycosyltransferase involved in cell wall biosynthesis [Curtobacterium flaccumfaciens]